MNKKSIIISSTVILVTLATGFFVTKKYIDYVGEKASTAFAKSLVNSIFTGKAK